MGAFCVFGVSRAISLKLAEKKTRTYEIVEEERRELPLSEWTAKRNVLADHLFATTEKPYRISPEFDAPQFCADWMAVAPAEIRLAKVMVHGPKFDKEGNPVLRKGVQVMAWQEFTDINQFKKVK